jgi:acyl-coenzyme A thioesterase PaaI-like protein
MQKRDLTDHSIMKQIRRAIALNRVPGLHFCGNFFALCFDEVRAERSVLHIDSEDYTIDQDGQVNIAVFALLADMGLATGIREKLSRSTRLATVSLSLQLTCAPRIGRLTATSQSNGFLQGTLGKQGLSQSSVYSGDTLIGFGTGAFMVLPAPGDLVLHPVPWIDQQPPVDISLDLTTLNKDEQWILEHAEQSLNKSLSKGDGFLNHFLGFHPQVAERSAYCELQNGPHISNRVGHVQGGITLGLAMVTAGASLSDHWKLTGVTASYISPGEGASISARSTVVHRGRLTAVVHTEVISSNGRMVLDVMTTHASQAINPV